MNPEDLNPVVLYYSTALFFAGLACLIHHVFLKKGEAPLIPHKDLKPWKLKALDLGLILTFVYLFIFGAGVLASEAYTAIYEVEKIPEDMLFILGFPMHLAILASLYGFFRYYRITEFTPINQTRLGISTLLIRSVYFYLAAIPILLLGSYLWPMVLKILNLPTSQQDLVTQVGTMAVSPLFFLVVFLAVVLAPISEEILFRAFLYRSLKAYTSPVLAAILTSLMFAGMHFNWLSFIPLFLLGLWLCRTYEKTGNIFVPIVLHGLFNGNTLLVLLLMNE